MIVVNSNKTAQELDLSRFDEMNIRGRVAQDVVTGKKTKLGDTHKFAGKTVTILEIK